MRINVPASLEASSITIAANGLIVLIGDDFANFIDTEMRSLLGEDWLPQLGEANKVYREFNLRDPSILLKDLARNGSSAMRLVVNKFIKDSDRKKYYDGLDDLLGERNAWIHRLVDETPAELLDLIETILFVAVPLSLRLVDECEAIRKSIKSNAEGIKIQVNELEISSTGTDTLINLSELANLVGSEEFQVGDKVTGTMLSHSYTLHLTGEIRDRGSGALLSEKNPTSSEAISGLLIARKPGGGRIRITPEGFLCAFFGERWGYLARVKSENWFPGHLE